MEKEKNANNVNTEQNNTNPNSTEVKTESKHRKSKLRMFLVILFIAVFALVSYVFLKGSYLEYKELGENYIDVFWTNFNYKYCIMGINFLFLYIIMYLTNKGIKKGLKVFFDQEKKKCQSCLINRYR